MKSSFDLRNGVLHKDGEPVFALGQSYYASYHPQKIPVLPEGDRIGEMKKDLKGMADAGFNIVRMAALGELKRESSGEVKVDFPLIDAIVSEAGKAGISTMVRLQGYSPSLTDYPDALMLNERDEEMPFYWGWFVRSCLNHPGVLKDDEDACVASAAHFKKFPSVVSFQIYNEPAYPWKDFYDYNPNSIKAWRKWMAERGLAAPEEAEKLEAPRRRPYYDEGKSLWVSWLLFHYERMNWYLNNLSDKAKEGYSKPETLTCHMTCPLTPKAAVRGEDYFRVAERMDIMGITHYIPSFGPDHYLSSAVIDLAESAAATFGKHAWIVEYNARTDLSANEWERETYSAIGSGIKGVMYYQWRADYPFEGGPEPEAFGMIFNNGRKSAKFDRAIAMNALVSELGGLFVKAEKMRSGVAVLFSEHASAWHDAVDNKGANDPCSDRNVLRSVSAYAAFRRAGVPVDFVRALDLAKNPLGAKLVVVPSMEGLSNAEKAQLEEFGKAGGIVCSCSDAEGFEFKGEHVKLDAGSVLEKAGFKPLFSVDERSLDVKLLEGRDSAGRYLAACLVNIDPLEKAIPAGKSLRVNAPGRFKSAQLFAPGRKKDLKLVQGADSFAVSLPEITTGAFLIVRG